MSKKPFVMTNGLAENGTSPDVIQSMLRNGSKGPTTDFVYTTPCKAQEQCVAENLELTAHFGTSSAKVCE